MVMIPLPPALFVDSAHFLSDDLDHCTDEKRAAVAEFLRDLDYLDTDDSRNSNQLNSHRIKLLQLAAKLDLFTFTGQFTAKAHFIGSNIDPNKVYPGLDYPNSASAGFGFSLAKAFESCVGEAAEYLSQVKTGSLSEQTSPIEHSSQQLPTIEHSSWQATNSKTEGGRPIAAIVGQQLGADGDRDVLLPSNLCTRIPTAKYVKGIGTGCATGSTREVALLRGLLEVIERDSAALWWAGGRKPAAIPTETLLGSSLDHMLSLVGRVGTARRSTVLDITTDVGVPVVAVISMDPSNNSDYVCGLAADLTMEAAVQRAFMEMLQMETGLYLVKLKLERTTVEELNPADKIVLERSSALSMFWDTRLTACQQISRTEEYINVDESNKTRSLINHLLKLGQSAYAVDLQNEYDIPVVKTLIPNLQLYPSDHLSQRLVEQQNRSNWNLASTGGISLV